MWFGRRRAAEASFGIGDSVAKKNRMGAQATCRAREELRPRGHLCLYQGRLGFLSEIYPAFAGIQAGIFRYVCYRLYAVYGNSRVGYALE